MGYLPACMHGVICAVFVLHVREQGVVIRQKALGTVSLKSGQWKPKIF